ncbi:MAG: tRNA preQ1(34) S-adenosylmethionine ribosyltransferase-isomerase QueA [Candidatus Margulisiibacteriota bacterium]
MRLDLFDYHLPAHLIANEPSPVRDQSRLMVVSRTSESVFHRRFQDIGDYLNPGDALVLNNTKVFCARLTAKKSTGAVLEVFLLHPIDDEGQALPLSQLDPQAKSGLWKILVKPAKRIKAQDRLVVDAHLSILICSKDPRGIVGHLDCDRPLLEYLDSTGDVPLPPYIQSSLSRDALLDRYQTIYAGPQGSVAAPTAGLHFTPDLLQRLVAKGVELVYVTLHVGYGTFQPITTDDITQHQMHPEWYDVSEHAAETLNRVRRLGGRVFAVGTTSARTLETLFHDQYVAGSGYTTAYFYPGYTFKAVDGLVTNFHLPKSSLMLLVSALLGRDRVMTLYDLAIEEAYRFFSFGDAMMVLP